MLLRPRGADAPLGPRGADAPLGRRLRRRLDRAELTRRAGAAARLRAQRPELDAHRVAQRKVGAGVLEHRQRGAVVADLRLEAAVELREDRVGAVARGLAEVGEVAELVGRADRAGRLGRAPQAVAVGALAL